MSTLGKHWKVSDIGRKHESDAHIGNIQSEATRKKLSENNAHYWLGKKREVEYIKQRNEVRRKNGWFRDPVAFSEKQKLLTKGRNKGRVHSKEQNEQHSVRITQKYLNGEMKKCGYGKSGYFFSQKNSAMIYYRSSFELVAMQLLEQMTPVISYVYEGLSIPYLDEKGVQRHTIPDLFINYLDGTKEVVEIKPTFKIKDQKLKLDAIENYCKDNGYKFAIWSEDKLMG
jgi:hypothetical protein